MRYLTVDGTTGRSRSGTWRVPRGHNNDTAAMLLGVVLVVALQSGGHPALAAGRSCHVTGRSSVTAGRFCRSRDLCMQSDVLVSGTGLSLTHDGTKILFSGIDLMIYRGTKSALVGANGVGKSSLMRVLANIDAPDDGSIEVAPGLRLCYVEQEPSLPPGTSAANFIFSSKAPGIDALRDYKQALADAETADGEAASTAAAEQLARAVSAMDATNAWDLEEEMKRLCSKLRVEHLLQRDASGL